MDDLGTRIQKAVNELTKRRLLVGIPSDATQSGGKKAPPLWLIGYMNEFGDDERHIPTRPFLVPGVQGVRDQIVKQLQKAVTSALSGDMESADKAIDGAGLIAQAAVKEKLINGPFQPLSPKTIYNRRHRKDPPGPPPNTRIAPLIDTGDMFKAINYVVRGR